MARVEKLITELNTSMIKTTIGVENGSLKLLRDLLKITDSMEIEQQSDSWFDNKDAESGAVFDRYL